jgi:SPP1 gp7 family putative phage head morphogenesis protein
MANTDLLGAEIAHQIDLIKTASGLGGLSTPVLKDIAKFVRATLLEYDSITSIKLRNELTKTINDYMLEQLGEWSETVQEQLDELIDNEIEFNATALDNATEVSVTKPTIESVTARIKNRPLVLNGRAISWDDYLSDYPKAQADRVKQIIVGGWNDGLTTREIVSQINGTSTVKGALQTSQRSAMMMAQDLTRHLSAQTRMEFGKANQDVIIGERVVATLDSKTSDYCRGADGQEYYYDKDGYNFPRPPFHPFCRSTITYITKVETDVGDTRPAVADGKAEQVSSKTTWYEWAKQNPSVAEASLGETRAYLLDNMSAEEFKKAAYNYLGEPLTLDEMKKRSDKVAKLLKDD